MLSGGISRSSLQSNIKTLQKTIERGQLVQPQNMYDPDLVHPYGSNPPGGDRALADAAFVLKKMDTYPQAPNVPTMVAFSNEIAQKHSRNGMLAAVGAVACAIGGAVGFAWLPQGHTIAQWLGTFGMAAAGCVVGAMSENKKAAEEARFAGLLDGWQTNIQNPRNLIPIPEHDCVNAEYMMYVEGRYISERRRHI